MKTLRLAVLISGRGSNLQALIDACRQSGFPASIAVVISNTPDAQGLERAAHAGIPAMIVDHTYFKGNKDGFENTMADIADQHGANFVALAGFMRILGPTFLKRFKDKVINIHPSLLPRHKGLNVHAAALKAGDKASGCSVHVVTAGMDEGEVIAQRQVPVQSGDTPDTLAARILIQEHALYPEVIKQIADGTVVIRDGHVERPSKLAQNSITKKEPEKSSMSHDHAQSSTTPVADPAAVKHSEHMWHNFVRFSTIAGGLIAVTLILMAVFLV